MHLSLTLTVMVNLATSSVDSVNVTEMMTAFLPVSEHIENEACRRDSQAIVQGVKNFKLWALKMADSSAKLPSGVLQGNIKSLGQYDECVEAITNDFSGQYCLASIHVIPLAGAKQHVTTLLDVATLGRRDREITVNRPVPDIFPSMSLIQLGVCVPSSCSPRDVEMGLSMGLQDLAQSMGLEVSIEAPPEDCSIKSSRPLDMIDYAMMITFLILGVLVMTGTALDLLMYHSDGVIQRIFLAFSIPANWNRLVSPVPIGKFSCLEGVRALSTFWIIIGHMVIYLTQEALTNKADIIKSLSNSLNMPWAYMPTVESFFLMSGMLRAFILLPKLDSRSFNYFKDACLRYLRLTPALTMVIFFYASMLPRLGSGPYWNKAVELPADACRQFWPLNLIYLNNYIKYSNKYCVCQSWYLSADIQLYLLAPFLLKPLSWFRPELATVWFFGLCLITSAIPFFYTLATHSLTLSYLGASDAELKHYQANVVVATHHRASPYVIGLALGYLFYRLGNHKINIKRNTVIAGWILSMLLVYAVVFGPYEMVQYDYQYNVLQSALYGALHRPAWAIGVAWIIFACHTGYGGWVNSFLTARVFQPLSRLSYCVYLTHYAVLKVAVGRVKNEKYFDEYDMVRRIAGEVVVCLLSALVLHLLVEAPGLKLIDLIFAKETSNRQETEMKKTLSKTKNG